MIIHTAEQGSEAWLAARRGVITASMFKVARDKLKSGKPSVKAYSYAMGLAREQCGGRDNEKFQTREMRMGQEEEPKARFAYEAVTGVIVEEAGFITDDDAEFGVSVDGFIGDPGIMEVKAMISSVTLFESAVAGDIDEFRDQIQGGLWLLGKQWIDLILWLPDAPSGLEMVVRRVYRDDEYIAALEADLMAFRELVATARAHLMQLIKQAAGKSYLIIDERAETVQLQEITHG